MEEVGDIKPGLAQEMISGGSARNQTAASLPSLISQSFSRPDIASIGVTHIDKLTRNNFSVWKFQMSILLPAKKCWE